MSERTRFKAWITKYALTSGIQEVDAEDCFDIAEDMIHLPDERYQPCFHGKEWHRSHAAAVARANEMRDAKIASIKKQITRLQSLKFGDKP